MKDRILLIFFVNIVLIGLLYFGIEYIIKVTPRYDFKIIDIENTKEININNSLIEQKPDDFRKIEWSEELEQKCCFEERKIFGEKYSKNPIIILGCSYAYGHCLEKEKTFPYLLSLETKRPVINFANCGSEILDNLEVLSVYLNNNPNKLELVKNADYIVYLYMWDHINRIISNERLLQYYNKIYQPSFFDRILEKLFVFHFLNINIKKKKIIDKYPNSEKSTLYLKNVILYSYKELKKYAPNAKMIIILYDEKISDEYLLSTIKYSADVINSTMWQELEKETKGDIKVLHTKDITGFVFDKDWKTDEDFAEWHPNARVWEYFTPLFAEQYIK